MLRVLRLDAMMRVAVVLIALSFPCITGAQVRQIRQFSFAPKQPTWSLLDLEGQFERQALAFTPQGDFLTLSPQRNGMWNLYRVRNWNSEKHTTDHLALSDYFSSRDQHNLENLTINIYLSSNGLYAICVGTSEWLKRVGGKAVGDAHTASIITVVDLATFKIANSIRVSTAEPFEFQSIELDSEGRILVTDTTFGTKRHGEFVRLEIPSLTPSEKCDYDMVDNQKGGSLLVPTTPTTCGPNLNSERLEDYFKKASSVPPRSPGFTCKDASAEYCPEPESLTPDGRFGMGIRTEGHDNILGSWVQTRATAILFSTKTHSEIGEIDMTHDPAYLKLAAVGGKDYLLSLKSGSVLTVYQLDEP
jgi:hypothetical protein